MKTFFLFLKVLIDEIKVLFKGIVLYTKSDFFRTRSFRF